MRKPRLKARVDGLVNVSLDPDAVAALDVITDALADPRQIGIRLTRSQTLRYVVKDYMTYAKMKAEEE